MYDTEEAVRVTLVCDNDVMKGVLDAFGMDIKVHWAEKGKFKTTVKVCASPTFFAWVFQWQGKVRIARPEKVVEEYREMVRRASGEE